MNYMSHMGKRSARNQAYAVAKAMVGNEKNSNSAAAPSEQPPQTSGQAWLLPQMRFAGKSFPVHNLANSNGSSSLSLDHMA